MMPNYIFLIGKELKKNKRQKIKNKEIKNQRRKRDGQKGFPIQQRSISLNIASSWPNISISWGMQCTAILTGCVGALFPPITAPTIPLAESDCLPVG